MENINAVFINEQIPQSERLQKLNQIAIQQMRVLKEVENRKLLKQKRYAQVFQKFAYKVFYQGYIRLFVKRGFQSLPDKI
jgi:5-methylcytosine-specific restriction endonuclease McrBC GTP-binding regulatory subunit McrB